MLQGPAGGDSVTPGNGRQAGQDFLLDELALAVPRLDALAVWISCDVGRAQAAIFAGHIDTVIVWKLDRLARNLKDGINVVADWCQRGIRVVSITQQIDLNGPVGQLIAGVLFGIAQIEHQHIRERQAIGIAAAKKRGIYTGRQEGTTKAQPTRARALRKQGLKIPEIAQALGVKQRTVYNYLRESR